MRFTHESRSQRVTFASGDASAAVSAEIAALGVSRAMVIASPAERELADPIAAELPVVLRHEEVVMHVPVAVAERARAAALEVDADTVVTVGGGSTTGLGKAVALTTGLPIVAVPTTYAGSEATDVWGLTDHEKKITGVDDRVLPRSVVYDASLLTTLPTDLSVASGLNALAHCIDSMWGPRVDPIDQALAGEGIRALSAGLPAVYHGDGGIEAVEQNLYGAYLAAVAFASAGSGMHHKICHVLGGLFGIPHAQTHAIVLPHVLAFNAVSAPDAESRISAAFGASTALEGLAALCAAVRAPTALRDYGMPKDGITKAVPPILAAIPDDNPTPVTEENLAALLRAAWGGDRT